MERVRGCETFLYKARDVYLSLSHLPIGFHYVLLVWLQGRQLQWAKDRLAYILHRWEKYGLFCELVSEVITLY